MKLAKGCRLGTHVGCVALFQRTNELGRRSGASKSATHPTAEIVDEKPQTPGETEVCLQD